MAFSRMLLLAVLVSACGGGQLKSVAVDEQPPWAGWAGGAAEDDFFIMKSNGPAHWDGQSLTAVAMPGDLDGGFLGASKGRLWVAKTQRLVSISPDGQLDDFGTIVPSGQTARVFARGDLALVVLRGSNEVLLFRDSAFTSIGTPGIYVEAAALLGPDDIFVCASNLGSARHFDGSGWSDVSIPDVLFGAAAMSALQPIGPREGYSVFSAGRASINNPNSAGGPYTTNADDWVLLHAKDGALSLETVKLPQGWREPTKLVGYEGVSETVAVVGNRPAVISRRGEQSTSSPPHEVVTLVANVYENGALGPEILVTDVDSNCDLSNSRNCNYVARVGSLADGTLWVEKTATDEATGLKKVLFLYGKVIR